MRRVGHVEHRDPERLPSAIDRVEREQQRRVVVRAFVPLRVDVAIDLEAARGALVAEQRDVAREALVGGAPRYPALYTRLGVGPGTAAAPMASKSFNTERDTGIEDDPARRSPVFPGVLVGLS